MTLVSNRCSVAPLVEQTLLRVRLQLGARAYLHHYERHGVGADYVHERVELMQAVVDDYNAAAARAGGGRRAAARSPCTAATSPASREPPDRGPGLVERLERMALPSATVLRH